MILKPLTSLLFFTTYANNDFRSERGGERVYRVNIISERVSCQPSKPLSVRLVADWNGYYQKLFVNFLLSYQLIRGTIFYSGLDCGLEKDEAGIFQPTGRYLFVKFSHWWRTRPPFPRESAFRALPLACQRFILHSEDFRVIIEPTKILSYPTRLLERLL